MPLAIAPWAIQRHFAVHTLQVLLPLFAIRDVLQVAILDAHDGRDLDAHLADLKAHAIELGQSVARLSCQADSTPARGSAQVIDLLEGARRLHARRPPKAVV